MLRSCKILCADSQTRKRLRRYYATKVNKENEQEDTARRNTNKETEQADTMRQNSNKDKKQ